MRVVLRTLLVGLVLSLAASGLSSPARAASGVPSKARWEADVAKAMTGSWRYVDRKTAGAHGRLAINLDIDNTSLATKYGGGAVRTVLRFTRHARARGVAIFFNTGRVGAKLREARRLLTRAGYHVDRLCGLRSATVTLVQSKKRCRARFVAAGYRIIANVGNSPGDFKGGNYDRAFKLPNYGGAMM